MKKFATIASVSFLLILNGIAEEGHDAALKKASIIKHFVDDKGLYHYSIPIAYNDADEQSFGSFTKHIKEILKVERLTKKGGFHFVTRRELTGAELMRIYQYRASSMGDVPNWAELVQLSKPKAKGFPSSDYKLTIVEKVDFEKMLRMHKIDLSGFTRIKRNCSGIYFPITEMKDQTLMVSTRAAKCSGHDNYSLRILNDKGEVMWQDLETLGGDLKFLRVNIDVDHVKEILFHQNDHGVESLLIFEPR